MPSHIHRFCFLRSDSHDSTVLCLPLLWAIIGHSVGHVANLHPGASMCCKDESSYMRFSRIDDNLIRDDVVGCASILRPTQQKKIEQKSSMCIAVYGLFLKDFSRAAGSPGFGIRVS